MSIEQANALAARLRQIREELYGTNGGPEMAHRIGIPARTWYNYEQGITIPGVILLRFITETQVSPAWLDSGEGPRFQGTLDNSAITSSAPAG